MKTPTTEAQHTKLPWRQKSYGEKIYASVSGSDGLIVADCGSRSDVRAQANARLIVQAVNNYAALLSACEAAMNDLQEVGIGINGLDGEPRELKRLVDIIEGRREALRTALASARKDHVRLWTDIATGFRPEQRQQTLLRVLLPLFEPYRHLGRAVTVFEPLGTP